MKQLTRIGIGAISFTLLAVLPAMAQTTNTPDVAKSSENSMAAAVESPKPHHKKHFVFGVNGGLYIPTDSKTRDRFGSSGFSIGPGFGAVRRVKNKGITSLSLSFISMEKGDNKFYMLPIGLQYARPLGWHKDAKLHPYYGLSLNAVPAKIRSRPDNVDTGIKLGYGGSAFVGTTIGRHAFVEGRYLLISKIDTFDLSGFDVSVGYRF